MEEIVFESCFDFKCNVMISGFPYIYILIEVGLFIMRCSLV